VGVLSDVWPVTATGAGAVAGAVVWHGAGLLLQLRRALPARFAVTVRYYVAASCFLPVGAVLGATLARGMPDRLHEQGTFAHAAINLLGWMGLTIVGTLVTLWPTMLRTRLAEGSELAAHRGLPVLVSAILVTAGGALSGLRPVAALGIFGYLAGLAMLAGPFMRTARSKPPSSYPTWSILASLIWLVGTLVVLAISVATAPSWDVAGDRLGWLTMFLVAGFAAQVLLGALSYLVPVVLGGGPARVRAAVSVLDKGGALRIVIVNASLLVSALPVPSRVRVICAALVVGGLAAFIPLLFLSIRASRAAAKSVAVASAGGGSPA
jgi:nitrite reductase (NO-forming)